MINKLRSIEFFPKFTSKEPFGHLRGGTTEGSLGFSFIQTIVIVVTIAVIIGVAFYLIDPITRIQKAKDNKRKSDLVLIQAVLKKYYRDFGKYPKNPGDCKKDVNFCKIVGLNPDNPVVEWGQPFKPYINILPKDEASKTYIYLSDSDRQVYYLYASLDREKDPQACNGGKACISLTVKGLNPNACGGICNYGVSSPNVRP